MDRSAGGEMVTAMGDEMADLYAGLKLDADDMPKAGPAELSAPAARSWSRTRRGGCHAD